MRYFHLFQLQDIVKELIWLFRQKMLLSFGTDFIEGKDSTEEYNKKGVVDKVHLEYRGLCRREGKRKIVVSATVQGCGNDQVSL